MNRIRPHITDKEAYCRCGCGLIQGDKTLDWVDEFIDRCGFPIPISTLARCWDFNADIGGVKDSPHLYIDHGLGAGDFKQRNPKKRMKMIAVGMEMVEEGKINQVECCDRHIHLARVPNGHRLAGYFNWGKSK